MKDNRGRENKEKMESGGRKKKRGHEQARI